MPCSGLSATGKGVLGTQEGPSASASEQGGTSALKKDRCGIPSPLCEGSWAGGVVGRQQLVDSFHSVLAWEPFLDRSTPLLGHPPQTGSRDRATATSGTHAHRAFLPGRDLAWLSPAHVRGRNYSFLVYKGLTGGSEGAEPRSHPERSVRAGI